MKHRRADVGLCLPASFWAERPYLAHLAPGRLVAASVSPDLVWEALKALYAATIPWNFRLPGDGTVDYISV